MLADALWLLGLDCPTAPCQIHPCKPELTRIGDLRHLKGSWLRGLPSEAARVPVGQGREPLLFVHHSALLLSCLEVGELSPKGRRRRRRTQGCFQLGWGTLQVIGRPWGLLTLSSSLIPSDRGEHHGGSGCWTD